MWLVRCFRCFLCHDKQPECRPKLSPRFPHQRSTQDAPNAGLTRTRSSPCQAIQKATSYASHAERPIPLDFVQELMSHFNPEILTSPRHLMRLLFRRQAVVVIDTSCMCDPCCCRNLVYAWKQTAQYCPTSLSMPACQLWRVKQLLLQVIFTLWHLSQPACQYSIPRDALI